MKTNVKNWWNKTVALIAAMDTSPVDDLYEEVIRLRREIEQIKATNGNGCLGTQPEHDERKVLEFIGNPR